MQTALLPARPNPGTIQMAGALPPPRCCPGTMGHAVQTSLVEVTLARPLALEEFSDYKALGRLALRESGRTVAVGIVTRVLA
jgi:hypothetical protein